MDKTIKMEKKTNQQTPFEYAGETHRDLEVQQLDTVNFSSSFA